MNKFSAVSIALVLGFGLGWLAWRAANAPSQSSRDAIAVSNVGVSVNDPSTQTPALTSPQDSVSEPFEPTAARASLPHQFRVLTNGGQPLEGARAVWTPLKDEWFAFHAAWPSMDWHAIEEASTDALSDRDGRIALTEPAGLTIARKSAIWVSHPTHIATVIELVQSSEGTVLPPEVRLAAGRGITATVIGLDGAPARGAVVEQFLVPAAVEDELPVEQLFDARRIFRRTWICDDAGRVRIDPMPGVQRLQASAADARAEPWIGSSPADVVLDLRPTFVVFGRAMPDGEWAPNGALSVRYALRRGEDQVALGSAPVRSDGSFGDVTVPLAVCDAYFFFLVGGDIAQGQVSVPPPSAGQRVPIEFRVARGIGLPIRVVDSNGTGISGATVTAQWYANDAWRGSRGVTNAEGLVTLRNCELGSLWIRARAKGHAPKLVESQEVSTPPTEPIVVTLEKAGTIHGQCVDEGGPVTDFTVLFWKGEPVEQEKLVVRGSVDGTFELDEAPLGEVTLIATCEKHLRSSPEIVHVTESESVDVTLKFDKGLVGRGEVVDAVTGRPVPEATVQVLVPYDGKTLRAWKTAHQVDRDGRFQVASLLAERNSIEVQAPGYAVSKLTRIGVSGQEVDFGTIGLSSKQSLELRLRSDVPVDFTQIQASLQQTAYAPYRSFSAAGVLRFENLDPGQYIIATVFPGDSARWDDVILRPGHDYVLSIALQGTVTTVDVVSGPGVELPRWLLVRAAFDAPDGTPVTLVHHVPEDRHVEIPGVSGAFATFTVFGDDQRTYATKHVALDPGGSTHVEIELSNDEQTFRVVDSSRAPVANARVILTPHHGGTSWMESLVTNAHGECQLNVNDVTRCFAALFHESLGFEPSRLIELDGYRADAVELVIDPKHTLRIRARERGSIMPAVAISVRDRQQLVAMDELVFTGSDGVAKWSPVGAGDYRAVITQPGFWREEHLARVPGDGEVVDVQVRRLGAVEFVLTDEYGRPKSGVSIDLRSSEFAASVSEWLHAGRVSSSNSQLVTDAAGILRIEGLPNGEFQWQASTTSAVTREGQIVVPPHAMTTVEIRM